MNNKIGRIRTILPAVLLALIYVVLIAVPAAGGRTQKGDSGAAVCRIPGEILRDVAEKLFGGKIKPSTFRKGLRRLCPDSTALKEATKDPTQAALLKHLTQSVFILARGPKKKYHAIIYKEGKLLHRSADIPKEHCEVLKRLFRPFGRERLSDKRPSALTVEKFLERLPDGVTDEEKGGIEQTLQRAGKNARELIRAVLMLRTGAEKQGACWLLSRMKDHSYVVFSQDEGEPVYTRIYDAQQLSAVDFYEIVHYAYRARKTFPWAKKLSEEKFRRFVLEYRHTEEPLAPGLRAHFFKALFPYVKKLRNIRDVIHQVNLICSYIVKYRKDMFWEDQDLRLMFATNQARCEGKSNFASEMLRSVGVPNGYAFTPAWAKIDGNHAWNVAFDGDKVLSFMGCGPKREKPYFDMYKNCDAAKIYIREPGGSLQDLTSWYVRTAEFSVNLGADHAGQTIHLTVFNGDKWRGVAKSVADEKGSVTFKDVGCNSDFLFSCSIARDDRKPQVLRTFILTTEGKLKKIILGEPDANAAKLSGEIEKLTACTKYTLKIWTGEKWVEVAKITADKDGLVKLHGQPGRLYKLDKTDGKSATRPFQFEKPKKDSIVKY